jgi:hypothetical protein
MTQIKFIYAVFGDLLNPNKFTEMIGINPTSFWYKDDIVPNRVNLLRKETCWEYSLDFVQTLYLEDCINNFMGIFKSRVDQISHYIEQNELDAKLYIVVEFDENDSLPALYFGKEFLNLLNKINCEIDIDLYNMTE